MERSKRKLSSPTLEDNPAHQKRRTPSNKQPNSERKTADVAPPIVTSKNYDADESDSEEIFPFNNRDKIRNSIGKDTSQSYQAREGGNQTYISMPSDFDFSHCMNVIQEMAENGKSELNRYWIHRNNDILPSDDGSESDEFSELSFFMDENQSSSRYRLGSIEQGKLINKLVLRTPNLSPIHGEEFPLSGTQEELQQAKRRKSPGVSPIRSACSSFCDLSSP